MKIKTYVINLKESVDRRERVLAETRRYSCMDVELVEAVDGKSLSKIDLFRLFDHQRFVYRMGRNALLGEIGCTLSHQKCYNKLLNSEEDVVLILEDDVFFFDQDKVEYLLCEIRKKIREESPCVISLTRHRFYYRKKQDEIEKYSLYRVREAWGACAYFINRKAAEKMLSINKPYFVADDFLLMRMMGINVQGIYPMLALGFSEIHQIESDVWEEEKVKKKNSLKYRIHLYGNGIYRRILLFLHILKRRNYKEEYGL